MGRGTGVSAFPLEAKQRETLQEQGRGESSGGQGGSPARDSNPLRAVLDVRHQGFDPGEEGRRRDSMAPARPAQHPTSRIRRLS